MRRLLEFEPEGDIFNEPIEDDDPLSNQPITDPDA